MNRIVIGLAATLVAASVATFGGVAVAKEAPESSAFSLAPGDIVVTDPGAGTLVHVKPSGTTTDIASGLDDPRGVAIHLATGGVAVVEGGTSTLWFFWPDGTVDELGTDLDDPVGVANGPDDGLALSEKASGDILRAEVGLGVFPDALVGGVPEPTGVDVFDPRQFPDIATSVPDGLIAFSALSAAPPFGGNIATFTPGAEPTLFAEPFTAPYGLDWAPDGIIYLGDPDEGVVKVVPADVPDESDKIVDALGSRDTAVDVNVPGSDRPYTVLATSPTDVLRIDAATKDVVVVATLTAPAYLDVMPPGEGGVGSSSTTGTTSPPVTSGGATDGTTQATTLGQPFPDPTPTRTAGPTPGGQSTTGETAGSATGTDDDSGNTGLIIGGIVGACVLLALLAMWLLKVGPFAAKAVAGAAGYGEVKTEMRSMELSGDTGAPPEPPPGEFPTDVDPPQ